MSSKPPVLAVPIVQTNLKGIKLHISNGKTFLVVHMIEYYNFPLLERFYTQIMQKYFPIKEELDPIETWVRNLRNPAEREGNGFAAPFFDVAVILDPEGFELPSSASASSGFVSLDPSILNHLNSMKFAGGSVAEYFPLSHCGLLTYFVVVEQYRPYKLSQFLVDISRQFCFNIFSMQQNSSSPSTPRSSYDKYFAFLAETNNIKTDDGVVPSSARHRALNRLGFRCLDMDYIQAPLDDDLDPCADLILLALADDNLPKNKDGLRYAPGDMMRAFVAEFTHSNIGSLEFESDDYYMHMFHGLKGRDQVVLMELPWTTSSTFQITSSPSSSAPSTPLLDSKAALVVPAATPDSKSVVLRPRL